MTMALYFLQLFIIVFAGIFIACRTFAYEITVLRKVGGAACFATLSTIPIPVFLLQLVLPALGLYVCLMDETYDRPTVNKVFALTYLVAVLATLALYYINGP